MITIGDYDTFKKFANIKPLIKSVKLRTLVGTHIVSEETIIDVPPEFNAFGDTMSVKLIPFIGRPFQLILGANILNPLKAKIDFSSNSVTINNQIIPFYNTSDENYEQNVICKETEICQIEKDDVNFKSVLSEDMNNEDIEYDIKSLFENSIDSDKKFVISDFIVNKYRSQIRIMKNKVKTFETLYNKYKIIYLEEKDLSNETYLVDLFRKFLCKGTVGIYSEISEEKFNIFKNKLMSIYAEVESFKFTVCKILAKDIPSEKDLYELIEDVHLKGNHRGISENFEEIKYNYFYPNLKKYINKFINACRVCAESKYDRKPIRKKFYITETPNAPNEIVHIDIFKVCNLSYLTTIDRFTKIASMHKITDRNMCTIKLKLLERFSYLGVPSKLIMDNEFNNALIRLFCNEKNIQAHFTTPGSHTGNADIERFHSNILEHLRILKVSHCNLDTEELVMQALGFYNNTIHHATKVKPFDFLDITKKLDLQQLKDNLKNSKVKSINRINARRESIPNIENRSIYIKNSQAARNKIAKRYNKFNKNNPNKIDIACVKRPLKIFP